MKGSFDGTAGSLRQQPLIVDESTQNKNNFDGPGDTIFALDEDDRTYHFDDGLEKQRHFTDEFDENSLDDESSDEGEFAQGGDRNISATSRLPPRSRHSGRRAGPLPNSSARLPSASIAASLPVTISRGFWPPSEAVDSLPDDDSGLADTFDCHELNVRPRAKTILPQRDDEMYKNIQAYSRSIQPADDPERLFGERPRRRYRTGEQQQPQPNQQQQIPGVAGDTIPSESSPASSSSMQCGGAGAVPISLVARDMNLPGYSGNTRILVGASPAAADGSTPRSRIIVPASLSSGHL